MPSQTIGRYQIEKPLGEGGMAVVYLAHDPNFERPVVIKIIKREYSALPEFRARFNREARLIARLEHDAIVPVYDFGEDDGQPYIVMRPMTGGTLADLLKHGPLPLPDVVRIIERVADALDYAHAQGIIHRDLKPGNILFDTRGRSFLSDFGIAKSVEATTKLTGTGTIGTPAYMSPEQIQAVTELDRRSDVYSLGVMTFELLTGELPFKARDAVGLMFAHVNGPIPDIRKSNPGLPRESDGIFKRVLAKKPTDRYQTTGEFAEALTKIAAKPSARPRLPMRGSPPGQADTPPKPPTPPVGLQPTAPAAANATITRQTGPLGRFGSRPWALWLIPTILLGVCSLVILASGFWALPRLLVTQTSLTTEAAVALATSRPATTRAPTRTSPPPTATLTPTITPLPTLGIGSTLTSEKDGMVMVYVPQGDFLMGSASTDEAAITDEKPQHTVYLDPFWIYKTEVTNEMYNLCIAASVCRTPNTIASATHPDYFDDPDFKNFPVIHVSWNDAWTYCNWAGIRLPTEAEWEKAARGEDGRLYPWGNEPPSAARFNFALVLDDPAEVGSYPDGESPYGALDLAGNVWEWVSSVYKPYPYRANDGREDPYSTDLRVLRGGSWDTSDRNYARAANRSVGWLSDQNGSLGFRCAQSAPTLSPQISIIGTQFASLTLTPGATGLPEDIPIHPDNQNMVSINGTVGYQVNASLKTVQAFYQTEMVKNGWQETQPAMVTDTTVVMNYKKDNRQATIGLAFTGGVTAVGIQYTP